MSGLIRGIGDLHLGHVNMALYRGFSSVDEHDEHIISNWNSVVKKRDTTIIFGDVTMETARHYHLLDRLNGYKKVILGNHDLPKHTHKLLQHVNNAGAALKWNGWLLTHIPIHESEIDRFKGNIHAHTHENIIDDPRYICVSAEQIDYTPIDLRQLIQ